ncbi:MAG: DNA polymerase III subunit chi [Betaproteobacteria bacterium]
MTQVDFYTHVENRLQMLCTLAAKALARNRRLMILTGDLEAAERVDKHMWQQPAVGFLPHCRSDHPLAMVTPIIIDHRAEPVVHEEILVNLCESCPAVFSRFERVLEIVGLDDQERELARNRYRFYRDRGYEIRTHDMKELAA